MEPTLYHQIRKLINRHQLQTMTLDIFDTIILNEYWPSGLRQYDLATKQLPLVRSLIDTSITAYELYDLRRYARELILSHHHTLRLDMWLTVLLELLLIKYPAQLTDAQQLDLLANLIKTELEFTLANCKPNLPLLTQLQALQKLYPDLKFYFVSHSYLTANELKTLLQIFQIDIFAGGVSSADLTDQQSTDDLFHQLPHGFQIAKNLHLGDHRQQDYLWPKSLGSQAIHYRPLRFRGLRTLIGQSWLQLVRIVNLHQARQQISAQPLTAAYQLLTACEQSYYHQLASIVSLDYNNYVTNLPVSDLDFSHSPHLKIVPTLHHATIIRAFIYLLANYSSPRWNAPRLLELILRHTSLETRSDLYSFCFAPGYVYSNLAILSFEPNEFYRAFLEEVKAATPEATAPLHQAYETAVLALPQDAKPLIFVTTTDDDTFELFHEFARLHNIDNPFSKLTVASIPGCQFQATTSTTPRVAPPYHLAPDTYLANVLISQFPTKGRL